MTAAAEDSLPAEVVRAFYPDGLARVRLLAGGMINATYLTTDHGGNRAITQRLHEIFSPVIMFDLEVVSEHMRNDGLEAARILPTQSGDFYATDVEGKVWRSFTYLENDPAPDEYDLETLMAMGGLVARLHRSFNSLRYTPRFTIPHFHDTEYYAGRLEQTIPAMPDEETHEKSQAILSAYQGAPELPDLGTQLIHGDPRTQNMLFREGKPFTLVDLDTVMRGSPWIDIGDFLRGLAHDAVTAGSPDPAKDIPYASEGYRCESGTDIDKPDFHRAAIAAARLITLELGMRFMLDIVDDNYFEWDQARYSSRRDNHMAQVGKQWQIYQGLQAPEQSGE